MYKKSFLIAFLFLFSLEGSTSLLSTSISTSVWKVAEISFVSLGSDPVLVEAFAHFSLSSNSSAPIIIRPLFWDGSSIWRVRFAAPFTGLWVYITTCSNVTDIGLNNQTGLVNVTTSDSTNPNYIHGHVRHALNVSTNQRPHLERFDGTPFLYFGDTHWMAADLETLNACNAPPDVNCSSAFQFLVQDRVNKGVSVYQTYWFGQNQHWWLDSNFTYPNTTHYSLFLDVMLDFVAEQGLVIALGVGLHEMSVSMPLSALKMLGRIAAARFGAHPIIWITAQEVNAPNSNSTAWSVVTKEMAADGYAILGRPTMAHMWPYVSPSNLSEPFIFGNEPWLTAFATQGGHGGGGHIRPKSHYLLNYQNIYGKPFLEAESMYENITCGGWSYANDTRAAAWKAVLSGSLGYTYGGAAVWLFRLSLNDSTGEAYNPFTWWYTGSQMPGLNQVSAMMTLLNPISSDILDFTYLLPRFSDPQYSTFFDDERTVLASSADAKQNVIYSYGDNIKLGIIHRLNQPTTSSSITASFWDPRLGIWGSLYDVKPDSNGSWTLPNKPDTQDWVMIIIQGG